MNITFHVEDMDNNREVIVKRFEVEHVQDMADFLLEVTRAAGYDYIGTVTLTKNDGNEIHSF